MHQALRIRDFRYLWAGRFVSNLGSWLLVVAIPAYVYQLTGSLLATGLTVGAEFLPQLLFGLVAGVVTDRWDRKRVMLASDVFRAVAVAVMLFAATQESLWLVYVALIAESTGSVLFRPASQAMVPAVVGTDRMLSSANSLNAFTDGTVRLVGPPLGAALMSLTSFQVLVLVDVASYLVSGFAVFMITGRPKDRDDTEAGPARGVLADLVEGLRYLRGQAVAFVLLPLTVVFLLANASLSALLVPFGVRQLGGTEQIGFVVSALGVGFLVGAVLIRALVDRVQPRYLLAVTQTATAIGFYLLFSSTSLVTALPAAVGIGIFGSMTLVVPETALQRVVPDKVLGRVSAVFFAGEGLATLAGSLLGPALAEMLSLSWLVLVACVLTVAGALAGAVLLPVAPELAPAGRRAKALLD